MAYRKKRKKSYGFKRKSTVSRFWKNRRGRAMRGRVGFRF